MKTANVTMANETYGIEKHHDMLKLLARWPESALMIAAKRSSNSRTYCSLIIRFDREVIGFSIRYDKFRFYSIMS